MAYYTWVLTICFVIISNSMPYMSTAVYEATYYNTLLKKYLFLLFSISQLIAYWFF